LYTRSHWNVDPAAAPTEIVRTRDVCRERTSAHERQERLFHPAEVVASFGRGEIVLR
jgi:hypothetical protein